MAKQKGDACVPEEEKTKRTDQKLCDECTEKFSCVVRSAVSQYHAHCTVCTVCVCV